MKCLQKGVTVTKNFHQEMSPDLFPKEARGKGSGDKRKSV